MSSKVRPESSEIWIGGQKSDENACQWSDLWTRGDLLGNRGLSGTEVIGKQLEKHTDN